MIKNWNFLIVRMEKDRKRSPETVRNRMGLITDKKFSNRNHLEN